MTLVRIVAIKDEDTYIVIDIYESTSIHGMTWMEWFWFKIHNTRRDYIRDVMDVSESTSMHGMTWMEYKLVLIQNPTQDVITLRFLTIRDDEAQLQMNDPKVLVFM
jgi:hypothetical protein